MALENINPTQTKAWQNLQSHFSVMQYSSIKEMFAADPDRASKFTIEFNDILLDYSKNIMNSETVTNLVALANEAGLKSAIDDYFNGEEINKTENRA
ncbi:MAG TPA: glucose-6-phosphate isomerase, partial [Flavobacterium sp.]